LVERATPIDLDDQGCLRAIEVHDIGAYRVLPAKFGALQSAIAQMKPEEVFSIRDSLA